MIKSTLNNKPKPHSMSFFNRFNRNYNDIDQSVKNTLFDFINTKDNRGKCCECASPSIKFVSITFKCILCSRCGNAHMDNMPRSVVKSTVYNETWDREDFKTLKRSGGNRENNNIYNGKHQPFPYDGDIDKLEVDKYIKDKYIYGQYMIDRKEHLLYNNLCKEEDATPTRPSAHNTESSNNVRAEYNHKPALPSKPRPDTKNFNPSSSVFTGEDQPNIQGNPFNSSQTQSFSQPKPAIFDGSSDFTPYYADNSQIYQPAQVYEQPMYQQKDMMQPNQQQQIMYMYSQPGVYQSGVEIGPNNPQYQQILNQQQLIQQQQYQQQQMAMQQQMYQQNQQNNNTGFY